MRVQLSRHKRQPYRSAPSHSLAAVSQLGGEPAHGEPLFEQQWKTNKAAAARASSPGNTRDRRSHSSSPTHTRASEWRRETLACRLIRRNKRAQTNKRVRVCANDLWVGRKQKRQMVKRTTRKQGPGRTTKIHRGSWCSFALVGKWTKTKDSRGGRWGQARLRTNYTPWNNWSPNFDNPKATQQHEEDHILSKTLLRTSATFTVTSFCQSLGKK